MKNSLYVICALVIVVIAFACSDDDGDKVTGPGGLEASLDDFTGYKSWEVVDYQIGPTNPLLGPAHMGTNDAYSRLIYKSPAAKLEGNTYEQGSIYIKETFTWQNGEKVFAESGGILAMVKRGGDFNPDGAGWEWFMISPDMSQIVGRGGADLMDGGCNSCHNAASSQTGAADLVFPHPYEYEAQESDFADYKTWELVGTETGERSGLGAAHQSANTNATRRIYKKQLLANPDTIGSEYPIGTIIVKEVEEDSEIIELTAMIKRGGTFNSDHNGWEWIMFNPADMSVMGRSGDLMNNGCNNCHQAAIDPNGIDYVFSHADDPFNN